MRQTTIDTAIAIPAINNGRRGYPFADMQIGDSIFVPATGANLAYWRKKTGFTYVTRKSTENGETGVRVWRIA